MSTPVQIDSSSTTPPFEQLRGQLLEQIRSGAMPAGTRLPTVRGLADELGLAPGTVARAYKELEQAEVVETRGRAGTFVSLIGDGADGRVAAAAAEFASISARYGVAPDAALDMVRSALGLGSR